MYTTALLSLAQVAATVELIPFMKEWGVGGVVALITIRLWLLVESEIKENRETRRSRQKREEENDETALEHLAANRASLEALKEYAHKAVEDIHEIRLQGERAARNGGDK